MMPVHDAKQGPDYDSLREAAPIALALSKTHCKEQCRFYHGAWAYLRVYGARRSVLQDHEFLSNTLAKAAHSGARRVLISGSADFGILSYVTDAFRKSRATPDITVLDLCQTPLEMNQWYAGRQGIEITTHKSDIRRLDTGNFDLVVSHNFLNFFNAAERREVVSHWAQILAPDGQILTVSRLRPGEPEQSRRFVNEGVDLLVMKTLEAREKSRTHTLIDADTLEALVRGFAEQRLSWNIRAERELMDPFQHAGLHYRLTPTSLESVPGERKDEPRVRIGVIAHK
jgi:SAM-dependent methyltransferase